MKKKLYKSLKQVSKSLDIFKLDLCHFFSWRKKETEEEILTDLKIFQTFSEPFFK